jgi:sulfur relay (sulfurtransferase) DsrC/TusE family protein
MKSVADRKKSQNIGEYLIYMYQMEDLIRSYRGNMDEIHQYVVSHYPVSDDEKSEITAWLESILEKMKNQEILEKGHLKELNDLVENLANLHWKLLKIDRAYFDTYNKAKPFILDAIMEANGVDPGNEIQICLNGVYGLLLNRLLGGKVEDRRLKAAEAFGEVLSLLNFNYQQRIFMSPN